MSEESKKEVKRYNVEDMEKILKDYQWEDLTSVPDRFALINKRII